MLEFQPQGLGLASGACVGEIPTNIDQSSNRCNSGSRWAIEDPKKGKSSEFDAEDDDHTKSGLDVKLWSHEGFKVCIWKCPTKLGENLKKGSSQIKLARVKLKGLVTLEAGCLNPFRYPTHDFK